MAPLVSSVRDDGSINTANTISAYRGFLQLTLPMIAKPQAISLTYRTPSRLINLITLYNPTFISSPCLESGETDRDCQLFWQS